MTHSFLNPIMIGYFIIQNAAVLKWECCCRQHPSIGYQCHLHVMVGPTTTISIWMESVCLFLLGWKGIRWWATPTPLKDISSYFSFLILKRHPMKKVWKGLSSWPNSKPHPPQHYWILLVHIISKTTTMTLSYLIWSISQINSDHCHILKPLQFWLKLKKQWWKND